MVTFFIAYNEIDFGKFGEKPVSSVQMKIISLQLKKESTYYGTMNLRKNFIRTQDERLQLYGATEDPDGFFDVEPVQHNDLNPVVDANTGLRKYYLLHMRLAPETMTHTRIAYSLMNLIADVGAAFLMLAFIAFLLLRPWAKF